MFYSQYWHISDNQKHAMSGTSVTMCDYCATFGRIGNQLPYRQQCDYCATFGRIGSQLPYGEQCDYCATFGRIGM